MPSSHPSLGLSVFFLSFFYTRCSENKGPAGGGGVAERGRGERRDRRRSDKGKNDESGTTARWHEGCSENRRETAKRDRKRRTPKGGRRLAHHTPLLKIPVWWRRAVLPSLPWVVRFLSFFYAVVKFFYARTKEFRDITRISRRVERNFITCAGTTPGPAASRKMILRKLPRLSEHRGLNFRIVLFGWGWGRWVVLFWVGLFRVRLGCRREG